MYAWGTCMCKGACMGVFTGIHMVKGGVHAVRVACMHGGGMQAGGTHPTGMLSCYT